MPFTRMEIAIGCLYFMVLAIERFIRSAPGGTRKAKSEEDCRNDSVHGPLLWWDVLLHCLEKSALAEGGA